MGELAAVVPAAGRGERLDAGGPKAFAEVAGRPLLAWALARLQEAGSLVGLARLVVALPPGDEARERFARHVRPWLRDAPEPELVEGGDTRQDSVWRALQRLGSRWPLIAVHDGARPCLTADLLRRVVEAARRSGAAVPALPVSDTVKRVRQAAGVLLAVDTVDRSQLRAVQTPQVFAGRLLYEAHERARAEGFVATDDAALVERLGHPVVLVEGDPHNLKVTTPADLEEAARRLAGGDAVPDVRVGFGYDVHRFAPEDHPRPLVLAGVTVSERGGLLGHSDADAVVHAVMDALLGAAGLPDIGTLFPPGDPRYAGADSLALLGEVCARLRQRGWRPLQVDVTIVAERPRVQPHAPAMRARLASALELPPDRVGIKATTPEGLGSLGRGEGLAAYAVCLLRRAL